MRGISGQVQGAKAFGQDLGKFVQPISAEQSAKLLAGLQDFLAAVDSAKPAKASAALGGIAKIYPELAGPLQAVDAGMQAKAKPEDLSRALSQLNDLLIPRGFYLDAGANGQGPFAVAGPVKAMRFFDAGTNGILRQVFVEEQKAGRGTDHRQAGRASSYEEESKEYTYLVGADGKEIPGPASWQAASAIQTGAT
jgi:hypothetical protein